MRELFIAVWSYKISLVPVLFTYLLFDSVAIVRRMTGIAYVPIYLAVFPSGHSDQLYAEYLNEDDFYGVGQTLTESERKTLRRKIQATAVLSMVFAAVVAPWMCGFFAALYLQPQQFVEFLWFVFLIKSFLIMKSLYRLRQESRAAMHLPAFISVVGIYLTYLAFVWLGLTEAFAWASTNISSKGMAGLAIALMKYTYQDLIINVVVVAALTWALNIKLTDPENITKPDESFYEDSTSTESVVSDKSE